MKTQKQNKPFEQNDPTRHAPLIDRYGVFTTKFAVQSKTIEHIYKVIAKLTDKRAKLSVGTIVERVEVLTMITMKLTNGRFNTASTPY